MITNVYMHKCTRTLLLFRTLIDVKNNRNDISIPIRNKMMTAPVLN